VHDGRGNARLPVAFSSGLHAFQRTPLLAAMHFFGKTYQEKTAFLQRRVSECYVTRTYDLCTAFMRLLFAYETLKEHFHRAAVN
jgi:hypothetical protein